MARRGLAILEVLIALGVTTVAIVAMLGSVSMGARLQERTRAYAEAARAVTRVHASLRDGALDARVEELRAAPAFADGDVEVEVRFPTSLLVEHLAATGFSGWGPDPDAIPPGWRYRDLDGDGEVELDPAATHDVGLVPVRVVARWRGGEVRSSFLVTER